MIVSVAKSTKIANSITAMHREIILRLFEKIRAFRQGLMSSIIRKTIKKPLKTLSMMISAMTKV